LCIVLALVAAWEVLPRAGLVPPLFLPPLSATLHALIGSWTEYASALVATLGEVAVALVLACGGGIIAGMTIGTVPVLRQLLLPLFSSVYAVPVVVLYPVLTVWLGIGPESKIGFATLYGVFPTLLTTAAGVRTIDDRLLLTARSMGATPVQRIVRVVLPACIPSVLAGLRLGGALVIVGVVVAEMLTSTEGIGFLVTRYRTLLDSAHVFAAVLMVLLLTLLFDGLVRLAERPTTAWSLAGREEQRMAARAAAG
jgi:NitT/TauT family transport system permease protein/taurine transport system permease protein